MVIFKKIRQWLLLKKFSGRIPLGNGKKVFVGLSGGVDSSVSAALLKYLDYDVEGVFIKVWQPDWMTCSWKEDKRDAMRVAADLNIPFHFLNLSKEYKDNVVDYMVEEYKKGRTPNPDVMCNAHVKFGGFYDWAKAQDKDALIATGHYAQSVFDSVRGEQVILKGIDKGKDQSYFIWQINADQLSSIIFPLGHIPKTVTRNIAEYFDLHNKSRKDSQGLCFIGHVDMKEFLGHFIKLKQGSVLDVEKNIIGEHKGSEIYTLGQRGGITLFDNNDDQKPLYVVDKDIDSNTITVSEIRESLAIDPEKIILQDCNWRHKLPLTCIANIRYHGKNMTCRIISQNESETIISVDVEKDQITPGQSIVLFDKDVCLGGGVVK